MILDAYVPLRFRTYREALSSGCVRLGDYETTLIELWLEPRTQVVRRVTVTSIREVSPIVLSCDLCSWSQNLQGEQWRLELEPLQPASSARIEAWRRDHR